MNNSLKFGLVLSSFLALAACETPPADQSGNTGNGGMTGGNTGGDMSADNSGELAPGVKDRVFFALNSSTIDSEAQGVLERQASYLKTNSTNVVLEGHCDERGTREFNIALGERRANAAKKYLVSLGVPASRVSVVSYGKERPAVMGSDESSWAQNRRAVTVLAK